VVGGLLVAMEAKCVVQLWSERRCCSVLASCRSEIRTRFAPSSPKKLKSPRPVLLIAAGITKVRPIVIHAL
jgi:hypothetical protein